MQCIAYSVCPARMQILHQYLKVNKQHAQFSNKQIMTMISASDFLSKFFSKMRKICTRPGSTTSRLIHVMPCIRDYLRRWHFSKLSKEQDWTQHRVLRNFFLDSLKRTNLHVYIENTIGTLKHSWQAETTIYCRSILAGLKFNKGSCLKLLVWFLSYLNLCFGLTENKVAVTEEWMRRRTHFTSVS